LPSEAGLALCAWRNAVYTPSLSVVNDLVTPRRPPAWTPLDRQPAAARFRRACTHPPILARPAAWRRRRLWAVRRCIHKPSRCWPTAPPIRRRRPGAVDTIIRARATSYVTARQADLPFAGRYRRGVRRFPPRSRILPLQTPADPVHVAADLNHRPARRDGRNRARTDSARLADAPTSDHREPAWNTVLRERVTSAADGQGSTIVPGRRPLPPM